MAGKEEKKDKRKIIEQNSEDLSSPWAKFLDKYPGKYKKLCIGFKRDGIVPDFKQFKNEDDSCYIFCDEHILQGTITDYLHFKVPDNKEKTVRDQLVKQGFIVRSYCGGVKTE